MITRFFANNYRTLVGFELRFDVIDTICGANGVGKSSVFDAIQFVSSLATGSCYLGEEQDMSKRTVSHLDFTNWMNTTCQEFEIEISSDGVDFMYILHLEQQKDYSPRVIKESAFCNGRELYTRDLEGVHFDNGRSGFPLDWHQAALASIQPVPERREIELLREAFAKLLVLRPNVYSMKMESKMESQKLSMGMENLTSWYRYLCQSQEYSDVLRESLKAVWSDLKYLELENAGMSFKILKLRFENVDLFFDQLSDGEKMLVGLYAVHAALALGKVKTVLIDEPDNYLSLQELQPWFLAMSEIVDNDHQLIVISHNGEILNINTARTLYFSRDNHSAPMRSGELKRYDGMLVSETLARGWGEIG